MVCYDVARKVLDTEAFPQHNIAGLIPDITFIILFSHEKPLRWKEIKHTHTHTHTKNTKHDRSIGSERINYILFIVLLKK